MIRKAVEMPSIILILDGMRVRALVAVLSCRATRLHATAHCHLVASLRLGIHPRKLSRTYWEPSIYFFAIYGGHRVTCCTPDRFLKDVFFI